MIFHCARPTRALQSFHLLYMGRATVLYCISPPNPYFLFKGGLVDPLLRASNEHILIVRVPRAGGQPGYPILFLHRHLHRNRLQRIIEFVARGGGDFIHHLHAPKDLTEDGIGSVQPTAILDTDIEL